MQRSWGQEEAVNSRNKTKFRRGKEWHQVRMWGSERHLKHVLGGHVRIICVLRTRGSFGVVFCEKGVWEEGKEITG